MSEEKLKYKVLHPIGLDGRRERGEILELTPFVASNYPGLLELVAGEEVKAEVAKPALEDMNLSELTEEARVLGLSIEGSKTELFERISLFLKGDTQSTAAEAPKPAEAAPQDVVPAEAPKEGEQPQDGAPADSTATANASEGASAAAV